MRINLHPKPSEVIANLIEICEGHVLVELHNCVAVDLYIRKK